MKAEEFRAAQETAEWNNRDAAFYFRVGEQTICNWRSGRQKIPGHVEVMFETALESEENLVENRRPGSVLPRLIN